ncbi:MAG: aminoglycoside adenylyltransferase domain-containing protein [Chloroflexota bacterium]
MNNQQLTPYPTLNHVLNEFAQTLQNTLGSNLIALYLQGSFALGDADESSDVDFLAVIEDELSEAELADLQAMHARIYDESNSDWARHLEGSYFPGNVFTNYERVGEPLHYLDNGARQLIRSDHCNQLVERWVVREHGIALIGPEASQLLEPVPVDALRKEVWTTMMEWGQELLTNRPKWANRWYQTFIVLSYCRMLQTLETGKVHSKLAGVAWGKENLSDEWSNLIQQAWDKRPDPDTTVHHEADPVDLERTAQFLAYALEIG